MRLSEDERVMLDEVAAECGGRSSALKQGLRLLVAERRRRKALARFVDDWEAESGPADPALVDEMIERYFSDA